MQGSATVTGLRLRGCPKRLDEAYDLALLDLDGVLYIGPDAVPGAPEAVDAARRSGMRVSFVTNNASRSARTVADHLTRLGIHAAVDDVVTSAQVAAAVLARRLPAGAPVLVIGGDGLQAALTEQGLQPVGSVDEGALAVVQGFNPDLTWRNLAEGTRAVRSGLFWLATNLDLTVPTPHGPAPGNGALVGLVADAAGRRPDEVAGKPNPGSFVEAARRYGSRHPLVVGDRLDTDLEGARAAGQDGLLVLTGVTGAADLVVCPPHRRPCYLGRDLAVLGQAQPEAELLPGDGVVRARCRQAEVAVDEAGLRVLTPGPDALDLLRAAVQAAWNWTDGRPAGGGAVDPAPLLDALHALEPGVTWAR
ncbi:MAG TPA: HAD-IIA family hydrolase [Kineosporiaceae bacterium]|nr:HAD-IIA family hydrolase [Kineosporiaceae bacterium]